MRRGGRDHSRRRLRVRTPSSEPPLSPAHLSHALCPAAPPCVLSGEVDASSFEGMVAMLEDIMMDEGFNDLVGGFMKQHCGEFDEGEENKLV